MPSNRLIQSLLFAASIAIALLGSSQATAQCVACGDSCIPDEHACCTDVGTGLQWVCIGSACGAEYPKCSGCDATGFCLGCTPDLPCPEGTVCGPLNAQDQGPYCYVQCAGSSTCPPGFTCLDGGGCCDTSTSMVCGPSCFPKGLLCCSAGTATWACDPATHTCGSSESECKSIDGGSDDDGKGGGEDCGYSPRGSSVTGRRQTGYWLVPGTILILLCLQRRRG